MQHKFDADPDAAILGLKVLDVNLVNKSGNEYKGIATIRAGNGAKEDVSVEVTADGDNVLWEIPPGALLFAMPDSPTQTSPVPGADAQGFLDGPRCSSQAALIVRTAQSAVAVCNTPVGPLYEGRRLSDGATISLRAVATATGFSATNDSDGTRYEISPDGLTIYSNGDVYTEQATAAGP